MSSLSLTFGGFIDRPYLFCRCVESVFGVMRESVEGRRREIIGKMGEILGISEDRCGG